MQPPHSPPPQQIPQPAQTAEPLSDATLAEPLVPPAKDGIAGRIPGIPKWGLALGVLAALGVLLSLILMQRLSVTQELLARQSQDSGASALEAKTIARQTQSQLQDVTARLSVLEVRLSEVALQRTQLEELMQSLSRSRDENLVVDIESAIRLAQQQAQLTGSLEPLLAALKSAELRVQRTAQPRLVPLQRAIAKDLSRIRSTPLSDTPALLVKLDELALLIDDIPLANAAPLPPVLPEPIARSPAQVVVQWGERVLQAVHAEVKDLVRVSRINDPQAALLSPEQSFFVRENLKLRVLNARLGLLARQVDAVRSDLKLTASTIGRYFDPGARKTQTALALVKQMQTEFSAFEQPRVDETLAALSAAAAGH